MRVRDTLIGFCTGVTLAGAAGAAASNWLNEAVLVRLPQSEIVRHPIDNGKYYLCWTDGVDRYGLIFRRSQLDIRLRSIPRASRVSVTSLMATPTDGTPLLAPWTASDEKICWPS
jgi:hypothetical protein